MEDHWVLEICCQSIPKMKTIVWRKPCHTPPASQKLMVANSFVLAGWNDHMEDSRRSKNPVVFAVNYAGELSRRKSATWHCVIEFSALPDCITNTTHIETLWQLPSAHSEEPEPFDLKHLIKAYAGLCLREGKNKKLVDLFSSIIHSSKPLLSGGPWLWC